jgi:hypothetical protein
MTDAFLRSSYDTFDAPCGSSIDHDIFTLARLCWRCDPCAGRSPEFLTNNGESATNMEMNRLCYPYRMGLPRFCLDIPVENDKMGRRPSNCMALGGPQSSSGGTEGLS